MRKRLIVTLAAMALALLGGLAPGTPATAQPPTQTGPYLIGDPAGERFATQGHPVLSPYIDMLSRIDESSWYYLNQQWFLRDAGAGKVYLVNGRDLAGYDVCAAVLPTAEVKPKVWLHFCNGAANQVWTIEDTAGGVRLVHEERGECLTALLGFSPNTTVRPCGQAGQDFVISPLS